MENFLFIVSSEKFITLHFTDGINSYLMQNTNRMLVCYRSRCHVLIRGEAET